MRAELRALFGRQHVGVVEQAAVEVADLIRAEPAAAGHGVEELAQLLGEHGRLGARARNQAREQAIGQQADIFGEQAEQQPDQEVRDPLRVLAPLAQQLGQARKLARGGLGDLRGGLRLLRRRRRQ